MSEEVGNLVRGQACSSAIHARLPGVTGGVWGRPHLYLRTDAAPTVRRPQTFQTRQSPATIPDVDDHDDLTVRPRELHFDAH